MSCEKRQIWENLLKLDIAILAKALEILPAITKAEDLEILYRIKKDQERQQATSSAFYEKTQLQELTEKIDRQILARAENILQSVDNARDLECLAHITAGLAGQNGQESARKEKQEPLPAATRLLQNLLDKQR